MTEMIDVVDEKENVITTVSRMEIREKGLLHKSAMIILRDKNGDYFLQKRSDKKDIYPGMLAIGVAETVKSGEDYASAAKRGLKEEVGLEGDLTELFTTRYYGENDNVIFKVFQSIVAGPMTFADGEVAEGQFVNKEKLKELMKNEFHLPSKYIIERYWGKELEKDDFIEIVDDEDKVTGIGYWKYVFDNHIFRSANVFVLNSNGKILVHQRSSNLKTYPGKYDVKVGGVLRIGESYEAGAAREMREEVGIRAERLKFLFDYQFRSRSHKSNRKVYECTYDGELKLQEEEIASAQFMSIDQAKQLMEIGQLSPSAEGVFREYIKWKELKKS